MLNAATQASSKQKKTDAADHFVKLYSLRRPICIMRQTDISNNQ